MNYDFFANKEDRIEVLEFILTKIGKKVLPRGIEVDSANSFCTIFRK